MIRLNQLKLPVDHTREQLIHKTAQYLRIPAADILELQIVRQSLDARKKPALFYSYSVNVTVKKEEKVYKDACRRLGKAMLFLWFMEKNGILYAENGHKRIADNTLVALTLMIAESRTEEKDVMVKVVVNLINKDNQ